LAQEYPERSRSVWAKLIRRGEIKVNGKVAISASSTVNEADEVVVTEAAELSQDLDLPVIYEDDNVLVINKPVGVLTHSKGALNEEFTVADFVKSRISLQGTTLQEGNNRFGIVHRLDRGTSGVLICAKNDAARKFLQKQFSDRKAKKTYLAIVEKAPKEPAARIDLPIARDPKRPSQFRVDPKGKPAITDYQTLETFADGSALLELKPLTGRTHQLRVHLAYIGAPIIGDPVYSLQGRSLQKERMFLHAAALEITIPGGERKTFTAELSVDFQTKIKESR